MRATQRRVEPTAITGQDRRQLATAAHTGSVVATYTTTSRQGCRLAVPPRLDWPTAGTMTRAEYLAWAAR